MDFLVELDTNTTKVAIGASIDWGGGWPMLKIEVGPFTLWLGWDWVSDD